MGATAASWRTHPKELWIAALGLGKASQAGARGVWVDVGGAAGPPGVGPAPWLVTRT